MDGGALAIRGQTLHGEATIDFAFGALITDKAFRQRERLCARKSGADLGCGRDVGRRDVLKRRDDVQRRLFLMRPRTVSMSSGPDR